MRAREIKVVVDNLIGNTEPIASSEYDAECFENIKEYIALCDKMLFDLSHIASRHKDSPYTSASKVGCKAASFLEDLRDTLNDEA